MKMYRFIKHIRKTIIKYLTLSIITINLVACGAGKPGDNAINNGITSDNVTLVSPQDIQITDHDGKLYINWSSVKGALNYKAYLSTSESIDTQNIDPTNVTVIHPITSAQLILDELELNTPYYIVVSALNQEGEEVNSPEFRIILKAKKIEFSLEAPKNFIAQPQEGQIKLEWDELPEALNYVLYYSTNDKEVEPSNANQIIEIASSPFIHKSLSVGENYFYRLGAVTPIGLTPLSVATSTTPLPFSQAPRAPKSFTATASDSLVALQWEAVNNANSYTLYMAKEPNVTAENVETLDGGEVFKNIKNVSANRLQLDNNSTYFFSVASVNDVGESPASISIAATPKSPNPDVPANVKAQSLDKAIKISWQGVESATSYTLYWSDEVNANKQTANKINNISQTNFIHEGLASPGLLYYFVTAQNDAGESESSALVSATPIVRPPPPAAPSRFKPIVSLGEITLQWEAIEGADEYVIYIASEEGITKDNYSQLENGTRLRFITETSITKSGLLPDTEYFFAIAAVNQGSEGDISEVVKLKTPKLPEEDTESPTLVTHPFEESNENIPLNAEFEFVFSEPLNIQSLTENSVSLRESDGTNFPIDIQFSGTSLSLTPINELSAGNTYTIYLNSQILDIAGNAFQEETSFEFSTIVTNNKPIITLTSENPITIYQNQSFVAPSISAIDDEDGDITDQIIITGTVDTSLIGNYTINYNVTDSEGLAADEVSLTVNIIADIPPALTLIGEDPLTVLQGQPYIEPGATAIDVEDGDISTAISITGSVDTNIPGAYILTYRVTDSFGNTSEINRTVNVTENLKPTITINGESSITVYQFANFSEPSVTASDLEDGNLTSLIVKTGQIDTAVLGEQSYRYNVTDSSGAAADEMRFTVMVIENNQPVINLLGDNPHTILQGQAYVEAGATATDVEDGDISSNIIISGTVDIGTPGTYTVSYNIADSIGFAANEVTRTVIVVSPGQPSINLLGDNPLTIILGNDYFEPGATATDPEDGDITNSLVINSNSVNTAAIGNYQVTYDVTDSNGITANQVIRNVNVVDLTLAISAPEFFGLGTSANLNASANFSDGTNIDITNLAQWSSSNNSIININVSTGAVDVNGVGDVTITVSYLGRSTTADIRVADLSPPTNLIATPAEGGVELTWTTNPNGGIYQVLRSNSLPVTAASESIASTNGISFSDTGLNPTQTYHYAIRTAVVHNGNQYTGDLSNTASAQPMPAAPVLNVIEDTESASVTIEWQPVIGAEKYLMTYHYCNDNNIFDNECYGTYDTEQETTSTSITFNHNFEFSGNISVYAVISLDQSGPTSSTYFELRKIPKAPTLNPPVSTPTSIFLSWDSPDFSHVYYIYRADKTQIPLVYEQIYGGPINQFTDDKNAPTGFGFNPGKSYSYYVTAYGNAGESVASNKIDRDASLLTELQPWFTDSSLYNCIMSSANAFGYLYPEEITHLTCSGFTQKVSNLEGIEILFNLTELNLIYDPENASSLADLSPLQTLPLTDLIINFASIVDASPLAAVSTLQYVDLTYNFIENLNGLSGLTELNTLKLNSNNISDITPLNGLPNLVGLQLANNSISNISGFGNLPSLEIIWLGSNDISEVYALSSIPTLTEINLTSTSIVEVSNLKDLTNLLIADLRFNSFLSCNSAADLDTTIDSGNGATTGIVTWTSSSCAPGIENVFLFDNSTVSGWRMNGFTAGDSGTIYAPNPIKFEWDDTTQFELTPPGSDILNSQGSLALTSDNVIMPTGFPTEQLWSVDLISPDLTPELSWQLIGEISFSANNSQATDTIWVQPLLNATRKSDGTTVFLREEDGFGNPIFYAIPADGLWKTNYAYFGNLSAYEINNVRLRVFGAQTSGALQLNIDEVWGLPSKF